MNDGLYIGVDGCRGGWIVCVLDHGKLRFERFDSLEQLVSRYPVSVSAAMRSSSTHWPSALLRRFICLSCLRRISGKVPASSIFHLPVTG